MFELLTVLLLQDKPGIFFGPLGHSSVWVSANILHSCSEKIQRGDTKMYVSLPPGRYASAVMCKEHSIVPFFLISNLLCLVPYFFRCHCQRYLVRFLFQVFVCFYQREAKYKFVYFFFFQYIWRTFGEWLFHNTFSRAGLDLKKNILLVLPQSGFPRAWYFS